MTEPDPREHLELLRPFHELWNSTNFQAWVKIVETQNQELTDLAMTITKAKVEKSAHVSRILTKLGLEPPVTREDVLDLMVHLRTVVNYLRLTLSELRRDSDSYVELEKELNARAAHGDLESRSGPRIVAR